MQVIITIKKKTEGTMYTNFKMVVPLLVEGRGSDGGGT